MGEHTVRWNAALDMARERGYFCRISFDVRSLEFYTGNENDPGTWEYVNKIALTRDYRVNRNEFERICRR